MSSYFEDIVECADLTMFSEN